MTAPVMSEGFASGTSTLVMIWNRGVPIASAASITPLSTSLMEDSTMRATYGAAAITSVTITALLPSDVPTMNFATGSIATMRMMNGTLRKALMRMLRILLSTGIGWMPSLSLTQRSRPSGRPRT